MCRPLSAASTFFASVKLSLTVRFGALSTTSHTSNATLSSGHDFALHATCAVLISFVGVYSATNVPPRNRRSSVDFPVDVSPRTTSLKLYVAPFPYFFANSESMRVIALLRNSSSLIVLVPFAVPLVVAVAYDGTYCETVSDRLVHQSDMTTTRTAAKCEDENAFLIHPKWIF